MRTDVADGNALVPFIFNIYQDNLDFPADYWAWERDRSLGYIRTHPAEQWAADYLRFYYRRWDKWDMEHTRRHLWWNVMAGGMGAHLGRHPRSSRSPYPDPDQLKTYLRFWSGRYRLEMEPANKLTDGYCIRTHTRRQFVFYKENTRSITVDLSGMSGAQPAITVDTKKPYLEIDLGLLQPDYQTWMAPHRSDWAIAVGEF